MVKCFFYFGFKANKEGRHKNVKINYLEGKTKDNPSWYIPVNFAIFCIRKKYFLLNMKRPGVGGSTFNIFCFQKSD